MNPTFRRPTRPKALATSLFLLILSVPCASSLAAEDGPSISLRLGSKAVLSIEDGTASTSLALTVQGLPANPEITITVVAVRGDDGSQRGDLLDRFEFDVETPADAAPQLKIEARTPLPPPGTYKVALDLSSGGSTVQEGLEVDIVVPEVSLDARPLKIRHRMGRNPELAGNRLRLKTGGQVGITNLMLDQVEAEGEDGEAVAGFLVPGNGRAAGEEHDDADAALLNLPISLGPVAAEERHYVELVPTRGFPIGKTTGTLELSAVELAEPEEVSFEYVRSLNPLWLLLPVALGLLVGYFVRVWLAHRIEVQTVKAQGEDLLDRLAAEGRRRQSKDFLAKTKKMEGTLRQALEKSKPEPIEKAITDVEGRLEDAIKNFEKAREASGKTLADIKGAVGTPAGALPGEVATILAAKGIEAKLDAAEEDIVGGRLDKADKALAALSSGLRDEVLQASDDWSDQALETLEHLELTQSPLFQEARAAAGTEADAAKEQLLALDDAADDLVDLVEAVEAAHDDLRSFADGFLRRLGVRLDRFLAVLEFFQPLPAPDPVRELRREGEWLEQQVRQLGGKPSALLQAVAGREEPLTQAFRDGVLDQLQGKERDKAEALLQEADLSTLRTRLGEWLQQQAAPSLAGADVFKMQSAGGFGSSSARLRLPRYSATSQVVQVPGGQPVPPAGEAYRASAWGELARLKGLRTLIVAVLILVAAFFVYEPVWIGTYREWIGLFFWAFGLDLVVETVTTVSSGLKPKSA